MARASSRNTPTSVILTEAQKAFIQKVAEKEDRSFSSLLRHIVTQWVNFHMQAKEKSNGEKGKEGSQKGQQEGQKGS